MPNIRSLNVPAVNRSFAYRKERAGSGSPAEDAIQNLSKEAEIDILSFFCITGI